MKKQTGPLNTAPPPPKNLPPDGKETWKEVCAYLLDRSLLHAGDMSVIEALAWSMARLRQLEGFIYEQGPFTPDGKVHPAISAANATAASVGKLANILGLAPISRSRLTAAVQSGGKRPEGSEEWLQVLKGGKK